MQVQKNVLSKMLFSTKFNGMFSLEGVDGIVLETLNVYAVCTHGMNKSGQPIVEEFKKVDFCISVVDGKTYLIPMSTQCDYYYLSAQRVLKCTKIEMDLADVIGREVELTI